MQQCLDREADSSYYSTGFPKIGTLDHKINLSIMLSNIIHKI